MGILYLNSNDYLVSEVDESFKSFKKLYDVYLQSKRASKSGLVGSPGRV